MVQNLPYFGQHKGHFTCLHPVVNLRNGLKQNLIVSWEVPENQY